MLFKILYVYKILIFGSSLPTEPLSAGVFCVWQRFSGHTTDEMTLTPLLNYS